MRWRRWIVRERQVLEAGLTPAGRSFFAMELLAGALPFDERRRAVLLGVLAITIAGGPIASAVGFAKARANAAWAEQNEVEARRLLELMQSTLVATADNPQSEATDVRALLDDLRREVRDAWDEPQESRRVVLGLAACLAACDALDEFDPILERRQRALLATDKVNSGVFRVLNVTKDFCFCGCQAGHGAAVHSRPQEGVADEGRWVDLVRNPSALRTPLALVRRLG
jgi:hypothetical protein